MGQIEISQFPTVSDDDISATVSVPSTGAETVICSKWTPPGLRGWIVFHGQAWDAAMDGYATYTIKVNGAVIYPYVKKTVQTAPPTDANRELPTRIPVAGGSLVEMVADSSVAGNFTGRMILKYTDPLIDRRP